MLALSPPLFSTTYGWPLEVEARSYDHSLPDFHAYNHQIEHDFAPENSISSGEAVNGGTKDDMIVTKKLNHNASERDRRKRVNDLYAFLRSLLPKSNDQKKKVSIPGTVTRALKYIPELQKEVEELRSKKEKLCSYSSTTIKSTKDRQLGVNQQSTKDAVIKTNSSVVSSVNVLGENEDVIQLIYTICTRTNKDISFLSNVMEYMEHEEDGIVFLNATTFKSFGEGMILNTVHFQMQEDKKIEAKQLKEKLCSFYQQPSRRVL
ncbi:transcription factor ORG2-like [Rutidosis leptorrhynchoides]|uniref:transcription factor ORG2-like n=1 Tax=Rutidosis leptorrhynchoides TaxID=125765 RepID=UPI003A9A0E7C